MARPMASVEILIDARGHRCPVPTLRLRRALEAAGDGARVRLLADDPLARIDVPHLAAALGAEVLERGEAAGVLSFLIAKPRTSERPPSRP
jgi:tRNA 2-thiouridine synthesizing protein A